MENEANLNQINHNPVENGRPYFIGQHALIKFSNGTDGYDSSVYWLVDKENHTIRPFESHDALAKAFGEGLNDAISKVVTVTPPQVDSNGAIKDGILADFDILDPEYSIREDGTAKPLDFSPHQLRSRYGKPIDEQKEISAEREIEKILDSFKPTGSRNDIPQSFIKNLRNNHRQMAFYISSLAYGEYSPQHVYNDILDKYNKSK